MVITFKVIPEHTKDEWIGWFGESVIKLRLTAPRNEIIHALPAFITKDLGIRDKDMVLKSVKDTNTLIAIDFPDVAWELFLSIIKN